MHFSDVSRQQELCRLFLVDPSVGTLFGGGLDAGAAVAVVGEEGAELAAGDDVAHGVLGHAVADDDRDALVQGPARRTHLPKKNRRLR